MAAIPLAFVLPALCYVKLETETPTWSRQKLPAIFMATFGMGVSVLSIVRMIAQVKLIAFSHEVADDDNYDFNDFQGVTDCAHGEEMSYCHAYLNATMRHI